MLAAHFTALRSPFVFACARLQARPPFLLLFWEILRYYQLSGSLNNRLPLRPIRHHVLQLTVLHRVLLQFFDLYRRFYEVDFLEHPDVLVNLLLELIFAIHVVERSLNWRIALHPLCADDDRLISHVGYAREIYEDLLCRCVVADVARFTIASFAHHGDVLILFLYAVAIPLAANTTAGPECRLAEQNFPLALHRPVIFALLQDAEVD